MGGTSTFSTKDGSIQKRQEEIMRVSNSQKDNYGNGICTMIMIKNSTGKTIKVDHDSYSAESGRWDFNPPKEIPSGYTAVCLHCKRDSTACGSIAGINVKGKIKEKKFNEKIWWDNPYSGTNTVGPSNDICKAVITHDSTSLKVVYTFGAKNDSDSDSD